MLQKDSNEYADICAQIGVEGINIPLAMAKSEKKARIIRRMKRWADRFKAQHVAEREKKARLTMLMSNFDKRAMTFFNKQFAIYGRAFFIVSMRPIAKHELRIDNSVRVTKMTGGRCLQGSTHFHYIVVTEFPVRKECIHSPYLWSISIVSTDSEICERYIRNQLYPGDSMVTYTCFKNTAGMEAYMNWCSEDNRMPGVRKEKVASTRYTWETGWFGTGKLLTMRRSERVILRAEPNNLPMSLALPPEAVFYCELNQFTQRLEGRLHHGTRENYANQPAVRIARSSRLVGENALQLAQVYPSAYIVILDDQVQRSRQPSPQLQPEAPEDSGQREGHEEPSDIFNISFHSSDISALWSVMQSPVNA